MTTTAPSIAPQVGDLAPDFTLPSTAGLDVTLSSLRGRTNALLAFFPLAFTSTCTAELCAFSEDFDRFASAGTVVLPISVDSVPTLREFKAKHGMKVDLLSDFKRTVARACTTFGNSPPESVFPHRSGRADPLAARRSGAGTPARRRGPVAPDRDA